MALSSTLYRFQIELADIDRGVYESLDLRVPCHPSEDAERLIVRVLARAIAHEEGLEFGRGLSNSEDPALWTQSAIGDVKTWIDVGMPGAERLHRASKRAERLRIFTHKLEVALRKEWSSRSIHKAESIELIQLPPALIRELAGQLDRNMSWYLTLQEDQLSVASGDGERSVEGTIERCSLSDFLSESD
jgi:uncharacterized protein YaeQ